MLHSSGGGLAEGVGNMETSSLEMETLILEETLKDIVKNMEKLQGDWQLD